MGGPIGNKSGFTMIVAVLALMLITILGFAITGITMSHLKMTKVDSRSQSAYYIAEAGINYMVDKINSEVKAEDSFETSEEFFAWLEEQYLGSSFVIGEEGGINNVAFERNKGNQPIATIVISETETNDDAKDYKIVSKGKIGNSTRTVSLIISVGWEGGGEKEFDMEEIFVFSPEATIAFKGGAINGQGNTIIIDGLQGSNFNQGAKINVTNIYSNGSIFIDSGATSIGCEAEPGIIYINGDLTLKNGDRNVYGDVIVKGNFELKDARLHGNVYVYGDLRLDTVPTIYKNIYYIGDIVHIKNNNQNVISKCIKVNSPNDFPDHIKSFSMPQAEIRLKDDSWFLNNGYTIVEEIIDPINNILPNNAKIYSKVDYSGKAENTGRNPQNMEIVISQGNINITPKWGNIGINAALIAPYGSVTVSHQYFKGIVISKEGFIMNTGGSTATMLKLSDFFGEGESQDLPFTTHLNNGPNPGSGEGPGSGGVEVGGSGKISIKIKSNIKEE